MRIFPQVAAQLTRHYPFLAGGARISATKIFKSLASGLPEEVWMDLNGNKICLSTRDFIGRSVYFFRDLDPKISILVGELLKPGDVALDIGANIGLVSLKMAQKVRPHGRVHSFEPAPRVRGYLERLVEANPDLPITVYPFGLGEEEAVLQLSIPRNMDGEASLVIDRGADVEVIDVQIRTLSNVIGEIGIERIDLIKLDVEGFEAKVIRGSADAIARFRPKYILFEEHGMVFGEAFPDSIALLVELGYRVFAVMKSYLKLELTEITRERTLPRHDFIAVLPEHVAQIGKFLVKG
jgi:FkbM family methyltransferase